MRLQIARQLVDFVAPGVTAKVVEARTEEVRHCREVIPTTVAPCRKISEVIHEIFERCQLHNFWVLRLDSSGNKIWERSFGGSGYDSLWSCQQMADGGFVLGGYSNSGADGNKTSAGFGGFDVWIVRIDANGNKLWERAYGGSGNEYLTALAQSSDGGLILGAMSASPPSGNKSSTNFGSYDIWILRLDAGGNQVWQGSFGGDAYDE